MLREYLNPSDTFEFKFVVPLSALMAVQCTKVGSLQRFVKGPYIVLRLAL
jgi:hypothetical protein